MPNPNQPSRPKTAEEILREMESMSGSSGESSSGSSGGGALKSLLGLFVKVHDDDEARAAPGVKPAAPAAPPSSGAATAPPPKRVSDLVASEPAPKFTALAAASGKVAADLAAKDLADIYREAGVPASPCNVDELAKLLENPTIASQPLSVKIVAVNLALSARGINAEAPIADAVRRDRALDAYQAMLQERAQLSEQTSEAKVQQISKEVEEYLKRRQAEMDALRAEATAARRQAIEFSVRREAEEKRLAELIMPFLEGKPNPVTIGDSPEITNPPQTKA